MKNIMPRNESLVSFVRCSWLPFISFIVLAVLCTDTNYYDGRPFAVKVSGEYYKAYIGISVLALLLLAWRRYKISGVRQIIEIILLSLIITNTLKYGLYALPLGRPPHMSDGVISLTNGYSPGFPSAHTVFAVGLAWMILEFKPILAPFWFAFAVAVGWSRIELFSHYPYQVLSGAVLGGVLGYWVSHAPHGILHSVRRVILHRRLPKPAS